MREPSKEKNDQSQNEGTFDWLYQRKNFCDNQDLNVYFRKLSDQELLEFYQLIPSDVHSCEICDGKHYQPSSQRDREIRRPVNNNFKVIRYRNPGTSRMLHRFVCTENKCKKMFTKWHNFLDHINIHSPEKPFICHHQGCNLRFTQEANLKKHLVTHSKPATFICHFCNKEYCYEKFYKKHLDSHKS